jgi:hypothetical protein
MMLLGELGIEGFDGIDLSHWLNDALTLVWFAENAICCIRS